MIKHPLTRAKVVRVDPTDNKLNFKFGEALVHLDFRQPSSATSQRHMEVTNLG